MKGVMIPHAAVNSPLPVLLLEPLVLGFGFWALEFCVGALCLRFGALGAGVLRGCGRGLIGVKPPFLCVRFTAVKLWLGAGCCCCMGEKLLVALAESAPCVDRRCCFRPRHEWLPVTSPSLLDAELVNFSADASVSVVATSGEDGEEEDNGESGETGESADCCPTVQSKPRAAFANMRSGSVWEGMTDLLINIAWKIFVRDGVLSREGRIRTINVT